jgi:type II secretory pathway pseudopilin PulG
MKSMMKIKNSSGFSLIELTIVIGLVGVVGFIASGFLTGMSKTKNRLDNNLEMQEYQRLLKHAFYKKEICEQVMPDTITSKETTHNEISYQRDGITHKLISMGKLNPSSKIHITKIAQTLTNYDDLKNFSANDKFTGVNTLSIEYKICPTQTCNQSTKGQEFVKEFAFPVSGVVSNNKTLINVECDLKFTEFVDRAVLASIEGFGLVKYINPITGAFEGVYGVPVFLHEECASKTGLELFDCEQKNKKFIPSPNGGVDALSKAFCDINKETMFDISKAQSNGVTLSPDDKFLMYTQFCPEIKSANCIWNGKTVEPGKKESVTESFKKNILHIDNMTSIFKKYDDRFKNSSIAETKDVKLYKKRGSLAASTGFGEAMKPANLGSVLLAEIFIGAPYLTLLDVCPRYEIQTQFQCTDSEMQYSSSQIRDSKFSWIPSFSKCGTHTNCFKLFGAKICYSLPKGPCCYWGEWQK